MGCYLLWNNTQNNAPARTGSAATKEELPSRITVKLVGANGETTAIGEIDTTTGEITVDGWYDLSGRKLDGKPSTKGIYIHNGKKIVIR